jgi:hypothetical protein
MIRICGIVGSTAHHAFCVDVLFRENANQKKSGHIMPGTAEQPIFYCGKDSTNCFDTNKMHAGKHHVYQNFSCFVGM